MAVTQRVYAHQHYGSLAPLLAVVYPSHDGYQIPIHHLFDQPVLAMKVDGLRIVLMEDIKGVNLRVVVTEETVHTALLLGRDAREAVLGHLGILLDQRLGYHQFLHTVLAWVLKRHAPYHVALGHGLTHLEGRVNHNAVIPAQHLRVHAAHRGSYNQVGLLALGHAGQHVHGLGRVYGYVLGHHRGAGQQCLQEGHRAALSR